MISVHHGDCREIIPTLGVTVDAVVTDPPYNLEAMAKRFGPGQKAATSPDHQRFAKGFMGMTWDSDVAFQPETWVTIGSVLRPGGFLVAFGGTRTHHRMVTAIEEAGFIIQDTISYLWVFASGFPKRRDMLKPAFEPILCARKRFNASPNWDTIAEFTARLEALLWVMNARTADRIAGGTDSSARWLVHAMQAWSRDHFDTTGTSSLQGEVSTSLSIALLWNAILGALSENESTFTTEMESSLTTGLRTLNSWLSEITPASITLAVSRQDGLWPNASTAGSSSSAAPPNWSGIPTVFAAAPVTSSTAIAILSTLADIAASSSLLRPATAASFAQCCVPTDLTIARGETARSALALNVAPFLKLSPAEIQSIAAESVWQPPTGLSPELQPIVLAYKPGGKRTLGVDECRVPGTNPSVLRRETARRTGNTPCRPGEYGDNIVNRGSPQKYMAENPGELLGRWPANVCHDGSDEVVACFPESEVSGSAKNGRPAKFSAERAGVTGFDAQKGSGALHNDSGSAARFFMSAKAGSQDRWGSRHPTVKPVDLIAWLVALVTPPGGTFLDPFAGSGTAAVAALKTGRNAILIEREESYYRDIMERIAFYEGGGQHSTQAKNRNRKVDHGPLFAAPLLTPEEDEADSLRSYNAAITAIGDRVKAGEPTPTTGYFGPSQLFREGR